MERVLWWMERNPWAVYLIGITGTVLSVLTLMLAVAVR